MKNVIIDFLNDADHASGTPYAIAKEFTDPLKDFIFRCHSDNDVYDKLKCIKSDDDWYIITILSHGNTEWLGMHAYGTHYKIPFPELLRYVNECVDKYNVYLNLMACCESYGIEKYLSRHLKIAEVWVANIQTPTVRVALMAALQASFESLNDDLTMQELNDYRRLMV